EYYCWLYYSAAGLF
nr:immunoglobulin light chain junction region [Macaca mulatta]MOX82511.1 immunoglobulin light chain junction region [Macaca mulatta]